jgi:hypothetical protein
MWNLIKSAFVLFTFSLMVAFIMFWVILGAIEMRKERAKLDYIHQYRIEKVKTMLEGRWAP